MLDVYLRRSLSKPSGLALIAGDCHSERRVIAWEGRSRPAITKSGLNAHARISGGCAGCDVCVETVHCSGSSVKGLRRRAEPRSRKPQIPEWRKPFSSH